MLKKIQKNQNNYIYNEIKYCKKIISDKKEAKIYKSIKNKKNQKI